MIHRNPNYFYKKKTFALVVLGTILAMISFNAILVYLSGVGIGEEKYISRYGSADEYGSSLPISVLALNVFNLLVFWMITKNNKEKIDYIFGRYMTTIAVLLCFLGLISTFAVRICDYFIFINMFLLVLYLPQAKRIWRNTTVYFYVFYWIMIIVVANLGNTYPYSSKILESIL